jgi:hypothetical protein
VRMKIVVHDPAWVTRTRAEGRDLAALLRHVWRRSKQLLCGMRGHDYVLKAQRRRMALHCPVCGHETVGWDIGGWDIGDPTPKMSSPDRPRYLELLRKRG